MTDKLHQLAIQEGIKVVYLSIPKICGYEGMYIESDGNPFIFLNTIVSERLGHSNTRITMDIYSHVLPSMQEEAVDKFEKMFLENSRTKTKLL
ncbi:hypothetical protein MK805_03030 [Shimazuella sp. AN120528]|nr:hypothetical protein [Shimazuella soli]MCH5583937.1 hypothetical protein [Shimazuella soli]